MGLCASADSVRVQDVAAVAIDKQIAKDAIDNERIIKMLLLGWSANH